MKAPQPSFAAGELAPALHGRTDLTRYAIGLATCRNVVIRPTGGGTKRTGTRYRATVKAPDVRGRLLPFVYSTDVRYLIEVGDLYFRFFYLNSLGQLVPLLDGAGAQVEVATPYETDDLGLLRITQSADVLFIAGINGSTKVPPKELRRVTPTSFELVDHANRLGPFRALNAVESTRIAISAAQGTATATANVDVFTAGMVGGLIYVEEEELRGVKPWEPIERNVAVGTQRRSDGKVFRAASIPDTGGLAGTPYYITGNTRPIHESGRAFDGPGDTRSDGVNEYKVGVEWEFLHATYGIAKITAFTDARTVTVEVVKRIPDSIIGTAPVAAGGPWTFSGNDATTEFDITGAASNSTKDYRVTIGGAPVGPDPYYTPDPGTTTTDGGRGGLSNGRDPFTYEP